MTREKVFKAAKKLFVEKGFYKTRSGDIAQCAGVSHGTVFSHFRSKSDILLQMQEEFLCMEIRRLEYLKTKDLSCVNSLKLMVNSIWHGAMRNIGTSRAIFAQSWVWSKEREGTYQNLTGVIRNYGAVYLNLGKEADEISPHLDVNLTMEIIEAILCESIRKSVVCPEDSDQFRNWLNRAIELLCVYKPVPKTE